MILVGETHDNLLHHELQLDVIRDLWQKKKPLAIGLEMVQTESQRLLPLSRRQLLLKEADYLVQ